MSLAHFFGRRFAEAAKWAAQAVAEGPSWAGARRYHAAALAQLGRLDEAGAEVKELLKLQPNSSLTRSRTSSFRYDWMLDLYIGALHRAGLPEN
jgi:Flp pilus assembly protein TadD